MVASLILLAIAAQVFHGSGPASSKTSVTSFGVLELIWISTHSKVLQDLMKTIGSSIADQLRLGGMKAEVSLADLAFQPITSHEDNGDGIQSELTIYAPAWQEFARGLLPYILLNIK